MVRRRPLVENTIVFVPDKHEEWWTKDKRYWMAMRTFVNASTTPYEAMLEQVCRRLQFLREKLIRDLTERKKNFFSIKNMWRNLSELELSRLHGAVRSYGSSTLM